MLNTNVIRFSTLTILISALAASACGGGGDDGPTDSGSSHDTTSGSDSDSSASNDSSSQKQICASFEEFANDCLGLITGCSYKAGALANACTQTGSLTEDALDAMVCGDVVDSMCSDKDFAADCDCSSVSGGTSKCTSGQTCSELQSGGGVCTVGTKPPSSAAVCTASTTCASGTTCVADAGSTTKGHCLTKCSP